MRQPIRDSEDKAPPARAITMASPANIIGFLKKMPELERLTIQEHSFLPFSKDLFAALKEVEDIVPAGGTSQRKMVVCPTLVWPYLFSSYTCKSLPSRPNRRIGPTF